MSFSAFPKDQEIKKIQTQNTGLTTQIRLLCKKVKNWMKKVEKKTAAKNDSLSYEVAYWSTYVGVGRVA